MPGSSEIKYVCFDIGGVANERLPDYIIASRVSKHFGRNFSEEDLEKMIYANIDGRDIWREFQNGRVDANAYINASFKVVGIPGTVDNKIFFYRLLEEWCGTPYQPILNLVDRLKQNGYHTSVLSNNNEIMYNTPGAEIKDHVNVAISSHEIGFSKPGIPAYLHLLDAIGGIEVRHNVLFVDDRVKNVDMANKLGIQGFHFRSKELGMNPAFIEFVLHLRHLGVKI